MAVGSVIELAFRVAAGELKVRRAQGTCILEVGATGRLTDRLSFTLSARPSVVAPERLRSRAAAGSPRGGVHCHVSTPSTMAHSSYADGSLHSLLLSSRSSIFTCLSVCLHLKQGVLLLQFSGHHRQAAAAEAGSGQDPHCGLGERPTNVVASLSKSWSDSAVG